MHVFSCHGDQKKNTECRAVLIQFQEHWTDYVIMTSEHWQHFTIQTQYMSVLTTLVYSFDRSVDSL